MARAYRLGLARRIVNAIIRALLRMGWGPARTYLLVTRGRTTGRLYRTPVTLVEQLPRRWLVAPYGERAWVKNARAVGSVELTRTLRTERVAIEEVDAATAAPSLREYLRKTPVTKPFFDVRAGSPLEEFAAEAPRHPVFRLLR